ncbi:MAG: hypothetical protein IKV03_03495 [Alphaproteobacteria bacterium]|nr:hypothetical protein [Alphaproteobacteria bacterium]
MRKILLLCSILMMPSVVIAQDTTTETCADGAGIVIKGLVSGHKYCKSKSDLNWWNAYAWCDAIGMQMVEASDCYCSDTTADCADKKCPEFAIDTDTTSWVGWTTKTDIKTGEMYTIHSPGILYPSNYGQSARNRTSWRQALCK